MRHAQLFLPVTSLLLVFSTPSWGEPASPPPGGDAAESDSANHLLQALTKNSGRTEPRRSESSPFPLLREVGGTSGEGEDFGEGTMAADPSANPYISEIDHSEQTVPDFLEYTDWSVYGADDAVGLINRSLDIILTLGGGYDSNPRLETTGEGEWVTWADLRFVLDPDLFSSRQRGVYYGFDIGSSVFEYDSNRARAGRDQGEVDVNAYTGIRGAKTDIRFDVDWQLNNGNIIDYTELDRETRRADSNDLDLNLTATRTFDHSYLTGSVLWLNRNFNSDTGLNDTEGLVGDIGWLYRPGFAPKTELGGGFQVGRYDTDRNVRQEFYSPSFRFVHRISPKTSFNGQVGYTLIDYDGPTAIEDNGLVSYGAGVTWAPTARTKFGLNGYREFSPSFTAANENYVTDGVNFTVGHLLPRNFTFRGSIALESADYFATTRLGITDRQDDYWRLGGSLSHPLQVARWLDGQVSAFYYYNSNDSSFESANFDQMFTGMKFNFSY